MQLPGWVNKRHVPVVDATGQWRLVECAPERLLYVSCKASTLAEELPVLLKSYGLERMWAVDLFPHTSHVEVLASLRRR